MNLKKMVFLCSAIGALVVSYNAFSASTIQYSTIINKDKQDSGSDKCIRTFSNNNSVSIGDCNAKGGATDYTSMRQWEVESQSNGFYFIKSKYKKDANKGQCLRTFNGNNELAVDDCNAQGGASDYTSMRLWTLVESGGFVLLQNKYKQDAGKPKCLRAFSNNNAISIGDCIAQGNSSDSLSMRQWLSDNFSIEKSWGPTGIVSLPYQIPDTPQSGFDSITFPMNIGRSPEERGFYYAMQYQFINGNLGYIGLQPRGKDTGLAIFSVFGSGVKPVASHCTGSADGGEGSSCSKTISLIFGHKYNLTVKRDDKNEKVWRGYVEDVVTGETNEIGAWQPREGSRGLNGSQVGFIEYYPQINSCSKIPYTEAYFVAPEANSALPGTLKKPNVYGKCMNIVEFTTKESPEGWDITLKGK